MQQRIHVAEQVSGRTGSRELEGLAGWLLARFRALRSAQNAEPRQMRLLETLSLGGKRQLVLVECAGQRFLVGGGLETVQTIVPISQTTASGEIAEFR